MPSSDNRTISTIMHSIIGIFPKSILDLGVGYGKYGALCREYVDFNRAEKHYLDKSDWNISIVGVEGFEKYRNPLWNIYDYVRIEDFGDGQHWPFYQNFDLVLLLDSLEHLDADQGFRLLTFLCRHNKNVLVSLPEGENPQADAFGNEFERHRSTWTADKLQAMGGEIIYKGEVCSAAHFRFHAS